MYPQDQHIRAHRAGTDPGSPSLHPKQASEHGSIVPQDTCFAGVKHTRLRRSWNLAPQFQRVTQGNVWQCGSVAEFLHGNPERPLHEAVKVKPKMKTAGCRRCQDHETCHSWRVMLAQERSHVCISSRAEEVNYSSPLQPRWFHVSPKCWTDKHLMFSLLAFGLIISCCTPFVPFVFFVPLYSRHM